MRIRDEAQGMLVLSAGISKGMRQIGLRNTILNAILLMSVVTKCASTLNSFGMNMVSSTHWMASIAKNMLLLVLCV